MPEDGKLKTLFSVILISLIAVLYFWSAADGTLLLTERDLSVFFIPPRVLWTEAFRAGEFPLWNPYSFSGHPLFATLQPGVLYPANLLFAFLPFDLAFNWTVIVHFALAGIFTFALLREYRAEATGAVSGAIVFMLSGYLFSVHNVMSTLFSAAWMPLAILTHLRAIKRLSLTYAAATGVTLTVMFLGGGIEVLLAALLILFVASIYPGALLVDGFTKASPIQSAGIFFLSVFLFALLSAIQLVPFLELAGQSTRAGGLSFFEATTWSFDLKDFIQFFIPDPYGYGTTNDKYWSNQSWLKTVYLGTLPFVLALFFALRRGRRALPFALLAALFLLLAMGKNTPVYQLLFEYLPVIGKIRYPVKFLLVPFLFIAIAAGLGLDALKEGCLNSSKATARAAWALLGLATLGALILGCLDYFGPSIKEYLIANGLDYPAYNKAEINIFNAKRVLFFFILSAIAVYAGVKTRSAVLLAALLMPILTIDLFFAHNGYYHATPSQQYHAKGPVLDFLSKDKGLFRTYTTPKTARQGTITLTEGTGTAASSFDVEKEKVSGYSLEHKVFDTGGVEVMKRADYTSVQELLAAQSGPDATNLLKMLNVKYLISIPEVTSSGWEKRDFSGWSSGEGGFRIYENKDFLPRHYMVYDYKVVKRPEEYLKALLDKGFDPGRSALLEKEPEVAKSGSPASFRIDLTSYMNNSSELKVSTNADGLLVASESWYPGWKVYVDGREAELLKADLVLMAVVLSAGEHTVRFVYSPVSFKTGAVISASGLALTVFLFIYGAKRGNKA